MEEVAKQQRNKNNVQVGVNRSKYLYCDLTKHLLAEGEEEVEISGVGLAIPSVVAVVELLKEQNMVVVQKISITRGELAATPHVSGLPQKRGRRPESKTERMSVIVLRADGFEGKYAAQQAAKKERKTKDEQQEGMTLVPKTSLIV